MYSMSQVQSRCIPSNLTGVFSYRNLWSRSMRLPGCWSACPWLLCSFFCFALAEFYFPFSPGDCSLSQRRIGRINQHIASDWDCFVSTVINTLLPRNKKLVQLLQKSIYKRATDWEQSNVEMLLNERNSFSKKGKNCPFRRKWVVLANRILNSHV